MLWIIFILAMATTAFRLFNMCKGIEPAKEDYGIGNPRPLVFRNELSGYTIFPE